MSNDRALREVERLLVRLHELIASDQTDSEAADEIRDRMDELSGSLSASELRRISELSGDLYMLTGEEIEAEAMRGKAPAQVHAEIASAFRMRRWTDLLSALRGPRDLPMDRVAYVRGRAWSCLGFHVASLKFYEFAYATVPNPNYIALAFDEYMVSGMGEAAESLVQQIESDPNAHPTLLLKASLVLLGLGRHRPDEQRAEVDRRLGELIGRAKRDPRWSESVPSLRAAGLIARAFALAHAGGLGDAESVLDEAIGISPSLEAAWIARGLVRFDAGRPKPAYEDLEEAVRLGASTVWPYFLLSHRALVSADFRAAAELSKAGARLAAPGSIRAKLFEWWAIALAELGHPSSSVLAVFDAAEAEDPFDTIIQANAARYRAHVAGSAVTAMWQPSSAPEAGSLVAQYSRHATPRDLVGPPASAALS